MAEEIKKQQIIIDIEAKNATQSIAQMVELRKRQNELKDEVKGYKQQLDELAKTEKEQGTLTDEQIRQQKELMGEIEAKNTEIKRTNAYLSEHQKVVAKSIDSVHRQAGSIKEMRASVAALTAEWENLSQVEREGARGATVQKELAALNDKINTASLSVKNFKDNIGNYQSALDGFIGNTTGAGKALQVLGINSQTTAVQVRGGLTESIKGLGFALKALTANPFFIILGSIVGIIAAITAGVKRNQEAMDAFQRILAPVGKLLDYIFELLGKVAAFIGKVDSGLMDLMGIGENAASQAVKRAQDLDEFEVSLIRKKAERNTKVANLEEELLKKEQYTHEERIAMAKQIQRLNNEAIEEERKVLNERLKIWELEHQGITPLREDRKKYEEMQAQLIELDAKLANSNKATTSTIDELNKALRDEQEAERRVVEAKRAALVERQKIQKELEKQTAQDLERLLIEQVDDLREKELKLLEFNHKRQVESLQKRLDTEKNLTVDARQNLARQIEILDKAHNDKILATKEQYRKQDEAAEAQRRLDANKLGLEQRKIELKDELQFTLELKRVEYEGLLALDKEQKEALYANEEAYQLAVIQGRQAMEAAEAKYNEAVAQEKQQAIDAAEAQRRLDANKLRLEQRKIELNDELQFTLELKRVEYEGLLALDEEQKEALYANEEAYQLAVIQGRQAMEAAEAKYNEALAMTAQKQVLAVGSIAGAMSNVIQQLAGQNEAMSKYAKALALVDIATNTGVAISGAIAAGAAAGPPPANLIAIATGVGAVATGIQQAYSVLKGSTPKKPKELGKSISVPMPTAPTAATGATSAPLARELGSIEARNELQGANLQNISPVVSVEEITQMQNLIKVKERTSAL